MKIESFPLTALRLDPDNARNHTKAQIKTLAKMLKRFSQQTPIVVLPDGLVVKGNATIQAASLLGWKEIDCVVTRLAGSEAQAYAIGDNKIGDADAGSTFDVDRQRAQIRDIMSSIDDFEASDVGFEDPGLDDLLAEGGGSTTDTVSQHERTRRYIRSRPGDEWILVSRGNEAEIRLTISPKLEGAESKDDALSDADALIKAWQKRTGAKAARSDMVLFDDI